MSRTKMTVANIYNPANQSEQELISHFVVRQEEFQHLLQAISTASMQSPEQDYIIQGPRGCGKTTLLLRLYYAIKNDPVLHHRFFPVIFSEEQYFIRTLDRLWEAVIDEIDLPAFSGASPPFPPHKDPEEQAFTHLLAILRHSRKKLLLFIDNIGDILDKFTEIEQHRLRERLLTSPEIRIIGASSRILEQTYDYSKPFFDFFDFIYLKGLTASETDQLLLRLSETYNETRVANIVKHQRERVETLRRLTGGIPRTIILLFEIFADDHNGNSFRDLETVLDRVTPLYKHRMDDLSPVQQAIVDAIAINWDAVPFEIILEEARIERETALDQLERLIKNRIVQVIPTPKTQFYQITERFFNIWYLMRYGRRKDKTPVLWLVRFLQNWCSPEELVSRARKLIQSLDQEAYNPSHAFYMTEALIRTELPGDVEQHLLEKTRAFLQQTDQGLLQDLSKTDGELFEDAVIQYLECRFDQSLYSFEAIRKKTALVYFLIAELCWTVYKNYKKAELHYLQAITQGNVRASYQIALLYEKVYADYARAEKYYLEAIEHGYTENDVYFRIALLYHVELHDYEQAKYYYDRAIQQGHAKSLFNLALLFQTELRDYAKAILYYREAITKGIIEALNNLALVYQNGYKNYVMAERYYLQAIDKGHTNAMFNLANLYWAKYRDQVKAEKYYLLAIQHGHINAMFHFVYHAFQEKGKAETINLVRRYYKEIGEIKLVLILVYILIWYCEHESAFDLFSEALSEIAHLDEYSEVQVQDILLLLIARELYPYTHRLFQENHFYIKERYKPIYYALMYFIQEKYPYEFLRMGEELQETVIEVVDRIKQLREDLRKSWD